MIHTEEAVSLGEEMAHNLQQVSDISLAWLLMRSPFKQLPEWSPSAVLIGEVIRRIAPEVAGWEITPRGFITEEGEFLDLHKENEE